MAVIEKGDELCSEVARQINERRAERYGDPEKILMSQRQFDVFSRWVDEIRGLRSLAATPTLWDSKGVDFKSTMFGIPIVICPDCDLYVTAVKDPGLSRSCEGLLPTRTVGKNTGGRFS